MANYTRQQIEAGIAKAEQQGNIEMVNKLSGLLNDEVTEERISPSTSLGNIYSLKQIEDGISKANRLGNEAMASKLTALYQSVLQKDEDPDRPSTSAWLANESRLGLTDSASLISAGSEVALQNRRKGTPFTPSNLLAGIVTASARGESLGEQFQESLSDFQKLFYKVTGADPDMLEPEDAGIGTKIAGFAVRTASDPFSFTGTGVTKNLKNLVIKTPDDFVGPVVQTSVKKDIVKPITKRATQAGGFGALAGGGGELGADIEQALTLEDTGTGRAIGTLLSVPLAAKGVVVRKGIGAGLNVTGQVWNRVMGLRKDPNAAADAYASGVTKAWLKEVADNTKNNEFDKIISHFKALEPVLGSKLVLKGQTFRGKTYNKDTKVPTLNVPLLVAMSDNPTVRATTVKLLKSNNRARAKFIDEIEKVSSAIQNRLGDLFGPQYATLATKETGIKTLSINKRLAAITDKLSDTRAMIRPDQTSEQIGTGIKKLVEARKKLASAERSSSYENLINEATEAKAVLPREGVQEIYRYARINKINELFGLINRTESKALRVLAPRQKFRVVDGQKVAVLDNKGRPVKTHVPISFRQLDSLKRAINEQLNKALPGTTRHQQLEQFRNVVDDSRTLIKGDFNQRLHDLDILYYEKIGIPFGSKGIKQINADKYAQEVAPVVVKNGQSLRNFLDAVGPDGVPIAKNAFLSEIYYDPSIFKNGVLNREKLLVHMESKEEVINQLPGLRKELTGMLVNQEALSLQIASLNKAAEAAKLRSINQFLNLEPGVPPNYQSIAREVINEPSKINEYLTKIKDLSPEGAETIKQAIRREVIANGAKNPQGVQAFLNDPSNQYLLKTLFGKDRTTYMKRVAELIDSLERVDIEKIAIRVAEEERDAVARVVPGLNMPYVTSQIRDKIASVVQKGVRLATRVQERVAKDKIEQAQIDILTDPNGLENALKAYDKFKFGIDSPVKAKDFVRALGEAAPLYFYTGFKTTINEQEEQ